MKYLLERDANKREMNYEKIIIDKKNIARTSLIQYIIHMRESSNHLFSPFSTHINIHTHTPTETISKS